MGLTQPRTVFGVHSMTTLRIDSGLPYGFARVMQGSTFTLEGDLVELKGGSNKYTWDVQEGDSSAELSFSMSEYPNWLFELFGGKAPTQGAAESSGFVSDLVNKKGTSIVAATGLLAAITKTVGKNADLKQGKYLVVATATDAIKVYAMSDIDFNRGADADFLDDTLAVFEKTAIDTADDIVVDDFGITLKAGASATAFVIGDTAEFRVRPINTFNREVKIGGIADVCPEFSATVYTQKNSKGAIFELEIFRLKNAGLTLGAERKAFAQNDYTAKAMYDAAEDGIFRMIEVA